ncbi:MAG: SIS domain-containing protein [Rhizobiaceae bacterium]|nr:SIS domain-containing protein [Rhizobiaceae bacterium]
MVKFVDIISELKKHDGSFPKREQRVADFVSANLSSISHMRQNEIADASNVSDATVNRFCQTLGCDGFKDFKIHLAQAVAVSLQYMDTTGSDDSESSQLVTQVFSTLIDTLNIARGQLESDAIAEAIDMLAGAKRILLFGVGGGSSNVAREGANRFFRLGIPAEAHSDGYLQRMLASTLKQGDVVFAISSSGTPAELLDSVNIAHQYGAQTISLTKRGSKLAIATNTSIEIEIPEDQDIYKPSASRLVFTAIVDVLAAGAARKRPEQVRENLRRIRTSLVPLTEDTSPKPIGD